MVVLTYIYIFFLVYFRTLAKNILMSEQQGLMEIASSEHLDLVI